MPLICYEPKKFSPDHVAIIVHANKIIAEFEQLGFDHE